MSEESGVPQLFLFAKVAALSTSALS